MEGQAPEGLIHRWLCLGLIGAAVVTFAALSIISAPYGRHARSGWGPTMSTRLAWVVMESPACLGFLAVFMLGSQRFALAPAALLALWQLHYGYRAFVFPWRLRAEGKRTAVAIVAMGVAFNVLNAYLNARQVSELGAYPLSWLWDPRFVVGTVLFLVGRTINVRADAHLIALRAEGDGYRVPHGGLFRWVSCPNYLGEIIEWFGWALATWSLAGLAFALYAVGNLAPRARSHHRWYKERFADYPPGRRALVPGLW
jgi:steroid 5-alpha reductase family enzyme